MKIYKCGSAYLRAPDDENSDVKYWDVPALLSPGDRIGIPGYNRFVVVQRTQDGKWRLNRGAFEAPIWIPDFEFDTPEEAALCLELAAVNTN